MRAQDGAVGAGGGEVEGREVPEVGGVLADGDLGEVVLVVPPEAAVDALAEVEEEAYEELQARVADDAHGDGVDAVLGDEVGLPDEALEEEAEEEALGLLLGLGVLLEGAVDDGRVGEGGEDDGLELGAPGAALEGGAALLELEGVAVLLNEARQHLFLSLFWRGASRAFSFLFLAAFIYVSKRLAAFILCPGCPSNARRCVWSKRRAFSARRRRSCRRSRRRSRRTASWCCRSSRRPSAGR